MPRLGLPIVEFPEELKDDVQRLYDHHKELSDVVDVNLLLKGAQVAREGSGASGLTAAEKQAVENEDQLTFLDQTKDLKVTILTTACAAITQGWQQSTINASSPGWQRELKHAGGDWINYRILSGLIDAAPWLSGSLIGIFVGFAAVWIVNHEWRVLLGTSAIPAIVLLFLVFLCPESPRFLIRRNDYRGAFLSLRQLRGTDIQAARDLYYIHCQLQAEAELLQSRTQASSGRDETQPEAQYPYQQLVRNMSFLKRVWCLWSIPRNRRACVAAFVVMASQQLCGINVLSFYSTILFRQMNTPNDKAESDDYVQTAWLNFGFGLANFLFTIPAYRYIDWRKGRRVLLLCSLGGMLITIAAIGGFFRLADEKARLGTVSVFSIVIFTFLYGIGAGPVPFTFSAEVFPLAFRGMSFSVMINFLGLGLLVMFVPKLTEAFGSNGFSNLLFLFTGLNALAFILVFFLVPSGTAGVSLEATNQIFETKTASHVKEHFSELKRIALSGDAARLVIFIHVIGDTYDMPDQFCENILTLLGEEMQQCQTPPQMFISRGALREIWSQSRLETFIDLFAPGFDKSSIAEVQERYVQTLSILVWIRWEDWANFGAIFLQQNRADCDIPTYDLPGLQDPNFLGHMWAIHFYNGRYIFCPIDILEGQNIERSEGWRLPFLDGGGKIGGGGFGVVDQETIARGHFRILSDHDDEGPLDYKKNLVVARKCFTIRSHFKTEMKNLSLLRASLSKHEHIVSCLATVTIGRDFNILFPWANMDLDKFLEGRYRELSSEFTLHDLMSEMLKLAGALSFLHRGLQPLKQKCRHRDLKPSNILLFFRRGFPVGQWKISDFGISIIDEPDQGPTTTISEFVNNNTYPVMDEPRYPNSTYQPPEVHMEIPFGRRSDVWSFGCILMRVLAFGLGGEEGLRSLDEQRTLHDGNPKNMNDRFYRVSPLALNPQVESWLTVLPSQYPQYRQATEKYADLIFRMLSLDKEARPITDTVYTELDSILNLVPSDYSIKNANDSATRSSISGPPSHNGITATVASLVKAIKGKDSDDIKTLLHGKVMVEETYDGDRPLIHAIRHFPEAVRMLQTYRPELDLETPDSNGNTPLKLAVETRNAHWVKVLLDAGVNINAPSKDGLTPLMAAAKDGSGSMIEPLLFRGADCKAYSSCGYTCFHYAAINSMTGIEAIRPFIERVDVDITTEPGGRTPLLLLIYNYTNTALWWKKFKYLVAAGADINKADESKTTPLSEAVRKHAVELAEVLLDCKAIYGEKPPPRNSFSGMNKVLKRIRAQNDNESVRSFRSTVLLPFRRRR
ncbi:uncharacterized protein KD926_008338 [Aspergillus affinis]|uniref:uncharacterized protein n=1 Tax=Aspergillus affinis TaxID=1070780 RepID=UPI0022FF37C1|nr:uncharacterized protein KD926_008338 [Aspergillus affinis]KAI9040381.1 hypothetical protein KD926_008338 [Aspergillus affinis]